MCSYVYVCVCVCISHMCGVASSKCDAYVASAGGELSGAKYRLWWYIYVCVHTYIYVCVHTYMYVYTYHVCGSIVVSSKHNAYVGLRLGLTLTSIQICIHRVEPKLRWYIGLYICVCVYTSYMWMYSGPLEALRLRGFKARVNPNSHTNMHTSGWRIYIYMHMNVYTHTHMHIHIYIYISG